MQAALSLTNIGMNIEVRHILGPSVRVVQMMHMYVPGCLPNVELATWILQQLPYLQCCLAHIMCASADQHTGSSCARICNGCSAYAEHTD